MIIFVGLRLEETDIYQVGLAEVGMTTYAISDNEFHEWFSSLDTKEKSAVETIVVGDCPNKYKAINLIKSKSTIPAIAINSLSDTDAMLNLFLSGADDVITTQAQSREIIARIGAIRRRTLAPAGFIAIGPLQVYFDGRDPEINGEVVALPRRERRILEYLAANSSRRVNRSMIFNAVYGLFEEEVEESVVESHISKLRKKLRFCLGFDPIDNQRYLGYQLIPQTAIAKAELDNVDLRTNSEKARTIGITPRYHAQEDREVLAA